MLSPLSFAGSASGIALEPTVQLDQEARYLNHLQHLRRINEGDDTADSPGYSLDLVRIPVSVLPGKRTDKGYGAEITFTATPILSDELLPTTFRNLVINDLVEQIGLPLTQVLNDKELIGLFLSDEQVIQQIRSEVQGECLSEGVKPEPHAAGAAGYKSSEGGRGGLSQIGHGSAEIQGSHRHPDHSGDEESPRPAAVSAIADV